MDNEKTDEQIQKDLFNDWFYKLLLTSVTHPGKHSHPLGSCLERQVLVQTRKELFQTWLRTKPHGLNPTNNIETTLR